MSYAAATSLDGPPPENLWSSIMSFFYALSFRTWIFKAPPSLVLALPVLLGIVLFIFMIAMMQMRQIAFIILELFGLTLALEVDFLFLFF